MTVKSKNILVKKVLIFLALENNKLFPMNKIDCNKINHKLITLLYFLSVPIQTDTKN